MEGTAVAAGRVGAVVAGLERFNERVGVAPNEDVPSAGAVAAAVVVAAVMAGARDAPPKLSDSPELMVVAAGAGAAVAAAGAGEPNDREGATVAAGVPVRLRPTPPNSDGLLVAVEPNEKPLGAADVAPTNEVAPRVGAADPSVGAGAPNEGAADVAVREKPPKSERILHNKLIIQNFNFKIYSVNIFIGP